MTDDDLHDAWWFLLWNHWLNPMGNWHEPLPFPRKRRLQAPKHPLLAWLWWTARNPLHNFTHFWIGITPLDDRYLWLIPENHGWTRHYGDRCVWWVKGWIKLPRCHWEGKRWQAYIGWARRGSFGIAFRRKETNT